MPDRRYDRERTYEDYRPQRGRYCEERDFHNDHRNPPPRDYPRRSPSPRRRSSPPPYDQRKYSDNNELKIKGASGQIERSTKDVRQDARELHDFARSRSPSPRPVPRKSYRDRGRENRRSISPIERERNRDRSWHRSEERARDRSRDRSRDRRQFRSRSRSHDRRRERSPFYGGPASREVILEGLPAEWAEDDVLTELTNHYNVLKLDDVRIIRERHTKKSRCFGFIRFPSFESSKAFVERNYPTIALHGYRMSTGSNGSPAVRIAYSRERDERGAQAQPGDWRCQNCQFVNFKGRSVCYQCQSVQTDSGNMEWSSKPQYANSGDSDVSPDGTPSQFLIVRGLEPTVTEDLFARGVSKLFKPSARQSPPPSNPSKKGNTKVQSTTGDANLGAKEGTLRRVLLVRDRHTNDSWRYGFAEFSTVDDAQAALIRYNSFDKFTIASKPVTADYVHAGIFVPVFEINQQETQFVFSPLANAAANLMYWDKEAYASELVVSQGPSHIDSNRENHYAGTVDDNAILGDKDNKAKKRKAEAKESAKQKKATPAHLQFWSDRHAELHGKKQTANDNDGAALEASEIEEDLEDVEAVQTTSYVDLNNHCCWLCMRQLSDARIASQHERTSRLHREYLGDEDAVRKAKARLLEHSVPTRQVFNTWIDLEGNCCYLCDREFETMEDTSRHENISIVHRENLSNEIAIRTGKALLGDALIIPTTVADPYLDPIGRCCYLCMTEFRDAELVYRHGYTSQLHRHNLRDEAVVRNANSKVGKLHKIVAVPLSETFIDPLSKACYLCRKQFSTSLEMGKHARQSLVHRSKMASEAEITEANIRLGRVTGFEADSLLDTSPEYRDRAAERRQAFGPSKKISLAFKKGGNKAEAQEKAEAPVQTPSKGASLLGKMGWSAGEGLGAQGTGMQAPISTDAYVQGVGLGAQGGRLGDAAEEAGRNTKSDYSDFLERTRDKAKERFQKMT